MIPPSADDSTMLDKADRLASAPIDKCLAVPGKCHFWPRLESAGEKFNSALIHHSARNAESNLLLKNRFEASIETIPARGWAMS